MLLPVVSPFRRVAKRLPSPAQLFLERLADVTRDSDWASRVADLRRAEQREINATVAAQRSLPDRQRILMLTAQACPPWTEIECGLATALTLRGHRVQGELCDGLMPVCEMNLGGQDRPACEVCVDRRSRYYEDAFGLKVTRLSDWIDPRDRDAAAQLVAGTSPDERMSLVLDDVPIGRLACRELQRYYRGFVFDPAGDPLLGEWLISAQLFVRLAERLIACEHPTIVAASSGRTLQSACVLAVARAKGIRTVTWDTEPSFKDGLVFSHDRPAVELSLDHEWPTRRDIPLLPAEREELHTFLRQWSRSENTPFPYNPNPIDEVGQVLSLLALRPGAPLVVAFANAAWDLAVLDRDVGFASMFEWLFAMVEAARRHPDMDFVIRAHPAETNVPSDLRARTPVAAEVRRQCAPLPDNLRLVEGSSAISSYTLARLASVVQVYSSRFGLEVALSGQRPWIAGDVNYRGKGFTRDLASAADMHARLTAREFGQRLSPDEIALAERFAHLWWFRHVQHLPLLRPPDGQFALTSFRVLAPGGDVTLDRICHAFATGAPFMDAVCNS